MPKEKRSRGTKAERSEEDRPLYLQQKAQAEAELARKKEEILTHFLRDKLQDDERNSVLNLLKLNDGWRSILRQSKSTEIKKDIDVLLQTVERQLDGLDSIMKNMQVNIKEAETQANQLHHSHHIQIKRLLELHKQRMDNLEHKWESTLEKIENEYISQREEISAEIQQQYRDIEDNSLMLQHKYDKMMSEISAVYQRVMDFYENLFLDKASKLEKPPEEHPVLQQLKQGNCVRREVLDAILKENQEYNESIQKTKAELQLLQTKWLDLQSSLSLGDDLSKVEEQLMTTTEGLKTLRTEMDIEQNQKRRCLAELSVNSDKAAKKILSAVNAGDTVLRLDKLCKKLEDSLSMSKEPETSPENDVAGEDEDQELWISFNRREKAALLQREALRRRRDAMLRENSQFHRRFQQLVQHQDTMSVSGQNLPKPDNKNGRTNGLGHAKQSQNPSLSLTGNLPIAVGQKSLRQLDM